jgi:tRNA(fMet)-specific endonuclease VapC
VEELEDTKGICVDTDVLIDFLRQSKPGTRAYEHWRSKGTVAITSITAFELLFGARQSKLRQKRYDEAQSLIGQQHHVFPFNEPAADKASEIGTELRRLGRSIEIRDLFNASICVSRNIPILTRNRDHYSRVADLRVLDV